MSVPKRMSFEVHVNVALSVITEELIHRARHTAAGHAQGSRDRHSESQHGLGVK